MGTNDKTSFDQVKLVMSTSALHFILQIFLVLNLGLCWKGWQKTHTHFQKLKRNPLMT